MLNALDQKKKNIKKENTTNVDFEENKLRKNVHLRSYIANCIAITFKCEYLMSTEFVMLLSTKPN